MSGKQANKKSATKAAMDSNLAPALDGARPEEFIIGNVRCFAGEQRVPIRPITLLVGENSTGKTTFLGGYRVLSEMLSTPEEHGSGNYSAAFNRPPFPMGKHRDIVRHSHDGEFCLGWAGEWSEEHTATAIAEAKFFFEEEKKKELPVPSEAIFVFRNGESLKMVQHGDSEMLVIGPGFRVKMGGALAWKNFAVPFVFIELLINMKLGEFMMGSGQGEKRAQQPEHEKLQEFILKQSGVTMENLSSFTSSKKPGTLMARNLDPFAPVRSKPKRTYGILDDDPEYEGGEVPALMFRLHSGKSKEWEDLRDRIGAFGKTAGMFSDFRVVEHGPESGGDFHLELKVRGEESNIMDVGYGVSQVYPMLTHVARMSQQGKRATFLLQQPEVHLHPRAQAEIGSFFVESTMKDGHTFLVETHSDFIVDRVRICMADGLIEPKDVALLYFDPQKSGGAVRIHHIELNGNGEPAEAPPKGYREFFLRETERVLGFRD